MKRFKLFFLLLALIMSATGAFAQAVDSKFTVDSVEYTITNNDLQHHVNNTVQVSNIRKSGDVTIPSTVQHPVSHEIYKVTEVRSWTNCNDGVTSLTFSDNLEKIGNGCYRNRTKLQKVKLPKTLKEIGFSCFGGCEVLTSFEVAPENTAYKSEAHDGNNWLLTKDGKTLVYFPSGISGNVTIPEGIITIGKTAFMSARKVEKIHIPASVTTIDETLTASFIGLGTEFTVNSSNPNFMDIDGVLCSKDKKRLICFPFHYPKEKLPDGKYTVPTGVETINSMAFYESTTDMTTLDLNKTKIISEEAINQANGLQSITFGSEVNAIAGGAIIHCSNLTKFIVDSNNPNYKGIDDMIYTHDQKGFILCPSGKTGTHAIREGTDSIATKAFMRSKLTQVTFPSSLKSIGHEAFRSASISQLDLSNCSQLTTIGRIVFSDNKNLTGKITIPANVTTIGSIIFSDTKVTEIAFAEGSKMPSLGTSFSNMPELTTFTFPQNNSLTRITANAFANDSKLKTIEIPEKVTFIDQGAFVNTPALETVTFRSPAVIETINEGAFGNSGIKSIALPESVTKIAKQAFDNCKNLETITIPKNVATIETGAFNFCEKMKKFVVDEANNKFSTVDGILCSKDKKTLVTFPAGKADNKYTSLPYFETIGEYAFYSSKKITNLTIPRTVKEVKNRAFALCDNLTSLSFMSTESVPTLPSDIIYHSPKPKDVAIYVRKAWYENDNNMADINKYNGMFKEVHPSFIVTEGYDRGIEFFPTAINAAGVISFYNPRTSVIIQNNVTEKAYTDKYNKHWPNKTYDVSAILDFAFEDTTHYVKMVTVLADINHIGLNAFKATTLKELYFVGNVPPILASTAYNIPGQYPFKDGQAIYVKQSKENDYKTAWNVDGHNLNITYKIPQVTNTHGGVVCFAFDVTYPQSLGTNDIKPYVPVDYTHVYDATTPYVRAYSLDNYYLPAFTGAFIRSKETASVNSYCQIDEDQAHTAISLSGYNASADNRMVGTVEEKKITNEPGCQYYAFRKSTGKLVKLNNGTNFPYYKSYFRLKNSSTPAKPFSLIFDDEAPGGTTGINNVTESGNDNAPYYNLNGVRVNRPTQGVYIHNGKKVVIK